MPHRILALTKKNPKKGFTLIEILLGIGLMSILAAIFGMGLVAAMQSYEFSRINVDIAQKGQPAMDRIARELRELTNIVEINNTPDQNPYIIYERIMPDENDNNFEKRIRLAIHFNRADHSVRLFIKPPLNINSNIGDGFILTDSIDDMILRFYQSNGTDEWNITDGLGSLSTIYIELRYRRPDTTDTQQLTTLVHTRNTGK